MSSAEIVALELELSRAIRNREDSLALFLIEKIKDKRKAAAALARLQNPEFEVHGG